MHRHRAEHVVFAFPLEDADVSRGASLPDLHGEGIAVARIFAQGLSIEQAGREQYGGCQNEESFHNEVYYVVEICFGIQI